jgi:hypothetical protein
MDGAREGEEAKGEGLDRKRDAKSFSKMAEQRKLARFLF